MLGQDHLNSCQKEEAREDKEEQGKDKKRPCTVDRRVMSCRAFSASHEISSGCWEGEVPFSRIGPRVMKTPRKVNTGPAS